ncbi:hypothetical protein ACN9MD_11715 [Stenotrophomonas maltophilia]|uniref:hypothetical protein n=1 Tax=Stenotrophomonas maltophilia TaxID=40324 RepID=UPI002AA239E1|nr:hypothetical protein [Stenotrophomonas maltophilia]
MKLQRPSAMAFKGLLTAALLLPGATGACELSVGQAVIDYGQISPHELIEGADGRQEAGARTTSIQISCAEPRSFHLRLDAESARNPEEAAFGPHGSIRFSLSDARVDGRNVQLAVDQSSPGQSVLLSPTVAVAAVNGGGPVTGSEFTAQLQIEPLFDAAASKIRDQQRPQLNARLILSSN